MIIDVFRYDELIIEWGVCLSGFSVFLSLNSVVFGKFNICVLLLIRIILFIVNVFIIIIGLL